MLKLSNIRIPVRIAIACLLPLLAFTAFAAKELFDRRSIMADMDAIGVVARAAPLLAEVAHELQKERGISVGYIDSREQSLLEQMRQQRPVTDKILATWEERVTEYLKAYPGTRFAENLETAKKRLSDLGRVRAAIDDSTTDSQKVMESMVSMVAGFLNVLEAIDDMTENGRVIHQANTMVALMRRKEYTAQGRGWGMIGFGAGQFVPQMYQAFMRGQNLADAFGTIFARSATQAQTDFVNKALDQQAAGAIAKMRQAAALSPYKGNAGNVTVAQWADATEQYINSLKRGEDRLLSDFAETVESVASEARWGFWNLLAIFLALLAVTATVVWFVVLSITKPVGQLVGTMATLAQGNNDIEVPGADRGDEIGHMARAVLVFRDAAIEKTRLEAASVDQQKAAEIERQRNEAARAAAAAQVKHVVDALGDGLDQLAKGALSYRITAEFADEYKKVQEDFNAAISQLHETISSIVASVREVSNAAAEISTSTTDLSQRTEEQAASLEETSASMEEISATVKQNAENAQQANQFATGTREVCDRGGEVVAEAVKAMSRIEESSRKISDIIGVIDEIARQTNLLALNAAVEAARAGEAGRGFAVVASEVRSLAQRSSQAAKDIKDLIINSSDQVQEGVELVNRAGTSLNEILTSIKKVADIVSDIAAASAEQATGLEQVNRALTQMDEVTQQNSALVEENAATAKTLEQQARAMNERVAFFRIDGAAAVAAPARVEQKAQQVAVAAAAGSRAPVAPAKRASVTAAPPAPPAAAPRRAAANGGGGPVGRMQAALATAFNDDPEWKEF
jgi:methyl-accepting chemotaxis protein